MLGFNKKNAASKTMARLPKLHPARLAGEEVVAICAAFAADQPHPERHEPQSPEEKLSVAGAAHLRLASVREAIGMTDREFIQLPRSASGYLLARTESRLLVFSGDSKTYLTESYLKGIWQQPIDHGDGMFTLVFKEGDERVAVTTRRESAEDTRHFVETFPDRRAQARVLHVAGTPGIASF